jgi:hypothetical protein
MRWVLSVSVALVAVAPVPAADPPIPEDLRSLAARVTHSGSPEAPTLKGVVIANRPIRDDDLAVLKRYPSVRGLDLQLLAITDKGLAHVAALGDLERLRVYKCFKLKDGDFAALAKLKKLRSLSLSATEIGDAGLKALCSLPDLEYLNIGDTRVTDAGLAELKTLPKLKVLVTWKPVVSAERKKELGVAIPGLRFGDVSDLPDPIFGR